MSVEQQWQIALEVLRPIGSEYEAVLARGGRSEALQAAYERMAQAADIVSSGCEAAEGSAHVQCVWVELEPMPLVALTDGTLSDVGDYVNVTYRRWDAPAGEAETLWSRMVDQMGSSALLPDFDQ